MNNQDRFAQLAAILFTGMLLPASGPVLAQGTATLEEIVVTAQRREQSLQEVPISLETVSGLEMRRQGFRTLDDLAEFAPGVELDVRTQDQNVSIRGMGTTGSSLALEQSAPMFIDGVVLGRTSMVKTAFFDLERMEILKGPQPVYFGQNAVSGAFSLVTRKPTPTWEADVMAEVGRFGRRTAEGGVGGPITDTLGIRVAGKYDETHGYLKDIVSGDTFPHRKDMAGRVTLQWTPTESFSATLKQEYTKTDAGSEATVVCLGEGVDLPLAELPDRFGSYLTKDALVPGRTSFDSYAYEPPVCGDGGQSTFSRVGLKSAGLNAPIPTTGEFSAEDARGNGILNVRDVALANGPEGYSGKFDEQEWYQTVLDLSYTLENGIQFHSLSGYADYYRAGVETSNNGPFFNQSRLRDEDFSQLSQEFRVSSPAGGMLEWMVGAYWQKNDLDLFMDNFGADMFRPRRQNQGWEDAEWMSGFAAVTFNFLDNRAALDVGARYTDVEKEVFIIGPGSRYVFAEEPVGGCAAFPRCEAVVTSDGLPGYTLVYRTRQIPTNWLSPAEPIGVTGLEYTIRNNPGPIADTLSDSQVDPQITLRYRPTDNLSLYARYATAFKAGGYDTGVASLPADVNDKFKFTPEQGETYEIGAKGTLQGGRLRYDVAAFNMSIADLQLATIVADVLGTGAVNVAEALNAGKQRTRGVEFGLDAILTDNLGMSLQGAIMDGVMVRFEGAGCTPSELEAADSGPCTSLDEAIALGSEDLAGTIDRSGAPAPRVPDWKFAVMLDYAAPLLDSFRGYANVNFGASDGYMTDVETFDLVQKYNTHYDMNLTLGIGDGADTWRISAYARNIFAAQEAYNRVTDIRPEGIIFDDAGTSWYTTYGLQFMYNYR